MKTCWQRIPSFVFWLLMLSGILIAQQPQNPSPMVEHTRSHPRLTETLPPGKRTALSLGTLFLPAQVKLKKTTPLLIHFHGARWIPETAAAQNKLAALSIQLGSGSAAYARPFQDRQRFIQLLNEAEREAGTTFAPIILSGWSAGYGAIRSILQVPEHFARVDQVLLIDGLHTDYVGGKPGPKESQLVTESLTIFSQFANAAVAGKKRMMITHSEIFPGTFASTTETTDWLLQQLQVRRRPVLKWGPMQTQILSQVQAGKFVLWGLAGNTAPDHVDQLHSLPAYVRQLMR